MADIPYDGTTDDGTGSVCDPPSPILVPTLDAIVADPPAVPATDPAYVFARVAEALNHWEEEMHRRRMILRAGPIVSTVVPAPDVTPDPNVSDVAAPDVQQVLNLSAVQAKVSAFLESEDPAPVVTPATEDAVPQGNAAAAKIRAKAQEALESEDEEDPKESWREMKERHAKIQETIDRALDMISASTPKRAEDMISVPAPKRPRRAAAEAARRMFKKQL